jgi:hypothetical protein
VDLLRGVVMIVMAWTTSVTFSTRRRERIADRPGDDE